MKPLSSLGLFVVALGCTVWGAQAPGASALVRLDPSLDAIVSPTAKVEILQGDLPGTTEGPVWINDGASGYLLFSDLRANRIYKWAPDRTLSVFLEKTGWSGPDTGATNWGSNGVTVDLQGRLVWVAQGDRAVIRQEKDGKRTVLVDRYQGKRFNRPNDLVVKSDGAIYFTDQLRDPPPSEIDSPGVYRLKDSNVQVVEREFRPNGLAFSPDEKYLYVNGRPPLAPPDVTGGKIIYRYEVRADGTLANRRVVMDMSADPVPGNADGMKVDQRGNIYCTGPGGLWIISPDGKHLGTILAPESIGTLTNVAFGDADGKTLYLTARRTIARVRANVPGVRPGPPASARTN